jgi:hypothetical protein
MSTSLSHLSLAKIGTELSRDIENAKTMAILFCKTSNSSNKFDMYGPKPHKQVSFVVKL